jgi:hypothetical protein
MPIVSLAFEPGARSYTMIALSLQAATIKRNVVGV